jgi:hypothetical protein
MFVDMAIQQATAALVAIYNYRETGFGQFLKDATVKTKSLEYAVDMIGGAK